MYVCMYMMMCMYIYVYMYTYMYVYEHIYTHIYIHAHTHMYVNIYVHIYIYIYIYIHTSVIYTYTIRTRKNKFFNNKHKVFRLCTFLRILKLRSYSRNFQNKVFIIHLELLGSRVDNTHTYTIRTRYNTHTYTIRTRIQYEHVYNTHTYTIRTSKNLHNTHRVVRLSSIQYAHVKRSS